MTPLDIDSADYERLRGHGITDAEIAEILAMTAFSMYATTLADAFHLSVDGEFQQILASA
jgi:alkylhydroperoxidase family enzyme